MLGARRFASLGVVLALVCATPAPSHAQEATTIAVDASKTLGPVNGRLLGLGWNAGSIDGVAALRPPTVRIDASLQDASTGPTALDLDALIDRVAKVRAIGAEPQVILSYMPRWLAATGPGDPRDPTRVAPSDFDAWQSLIETVVHALATAPAPARRFEVWNEPDVPVFWQDSPSRFFELARRTHDAIAAVEARSGLDLEIGGPAAAFPDPVFMLGYLHIASAGGRDADYLSWHFYGNHPAFGPDGNEGFVPDPVYQAGAHRNPFTSPAEFGSQVELVRGWAGDVPLVIDEWNVAAAGFDKRHDTHEGAAFDAASLIEMERAGLDAADFYRAADEPGTTREGRWGLVDGAGERKPAWWVFHAFSSTRRAQHIAVSGDDPAGGLWARATRERSHVDVVLASFTASDGEDRVASVEIAGFKAGCADIRTLTTPDSSFAKRKLRRVADGRVLVDVPSPSVVWLRIRRPACRKTNPGRRPG